MTKDQIVLAEGSVFSADSHVTGLNNNVVICGTSGCGKTVSVTEANLLHTYDSSLVVTLTKRRLVDEYVKLFEQRGYRTEILDLVDPESGTIGYDPLLITKTTDDLRHLAKFICCSSEVRGSDPYWVYATEALLLSIMASACYPFPAGGSMEDFLKTVEKFRYQNVEIREQKGERVEFRTVMKTTIDKLMEDYKIANPRSSLVNGWDSFKALPEKTAGCIFSMLNSYLSEYQSGAIRKSISMQNKFDPVMLTREKTILFIVSSPVNKSTLKSVNMLYDQTLKNLFEYAESRSDRVLPIPVRMICDDFATGGMIESFDEQISIFREKRLSVTLMLQSESQLEDMYGSGKATTIINNCDTYVYMGGTDLKTAESISRRTDMPLQDILSMPLGEVYVMRRGSRPHRTRRYDTYHDPEYTAFHEKVEETGKTKESTLQYRGIYGNIHRSTRRTFYAFGNSSMDCKTLEELMELYRQHGYSILDKKEAASYVWMESRGGKRNVEFLKNPDASGYEYVLLSRLDVHDLDNVYRKFCAGRPGYRRRRNRSIRAEGRKEGLEENRNAS